MADGNLEPTSPSRSAPSRAAGVTRPPMGSRKCSSTNPSMCANAVATLAAAVSARASAAPRCAAPTSALLTEWNAAGANAPKGCAPAAHIQASFLSSCAELQRSCGSAAPARARATPATIGPMALRASTVTVRPCETNASGSASSAVCSTATPSGADATRLSPSMAVPRGRPVHEKRYTGSTCVPPLKAEPTSPASDRNAAALRALPCEPSLVAVSA
mmetsp:Transcript_9846/g.40651  ORF Transcript_9846/g.40651 Transcript_9846/m.40651 type:complete len:217 (-) Transcript_9846:377-1027(-)